MTALRARLGYVRCRNQSIGCKAMKPNQMPVNGYVEGYDETASHGEYQRLAEFRYWGDAIAFAKAAHAANSNWTVRAYSVRTGSGLDALQWHSDVIRDAKSALNKAQHVSP